MIKVVCAIIIIDDKILIAQRGENMSHSLQWEFPGGKLNQGESEEMGLRRELYEELNIIVEPIIRLPSCKHSYKNKVIELLPYICINMKGKIQVKEHKAVQQVNFDELGNFNWVEADIKIVNYFLDNRELIMEKVKKIRDKRATLVLGASPKEDRYSYMAVKKLKSCSHEVVAIGNKEGYIDETPILTELSHYENIHTVTLYVGPQNQEQYYKYILDLQPYRVIFNPGTENPEFYKLLEEKNIAYLEACTLVMLRTGQY